MTKSSKPALGSAAKSEPVGALLSCIPVGKNTTGLVTPTKRWTIGRLQGSGRLGSLGSARSPKSSTEELVAGLGPVFDTDFRLEGCLCMYIYMCIYVCICIYNLLWLVEATGHVRTTTALGGPGPHRGRSPQRLRFVISARTPYLQLPRYGLVTSVARNPINS